MGKADRARGGAVVRRKKEEGRLPFRLEQAVIAGKTPHAVLIAGPEALGLVAALSLSKVLLCSKRIGAQPCMNCSACSSFDAGSNPDYRFLGLAETQTMDLLEENEPTRGVRTLKVDQTRKLLQATHLRSLGDAGSVFLITNAEALTPQAARALLKLVEEPPQKLTWILQTALPHMLPDTLLSRATTYTIAIDPSLKPGALKDATQLLARLEDRDYYGLLCLQPKLTVDRIRFIQVCDAIIVLCVQKCQSEQALQPSKYFGLSPIVSAFRERAEGSASLPLLSAAFLVECWQHMSGVNGSSAFE